MFGWGNQAKKAGEGIKEAGDGLGSVVDSLSHALTGNLPAETKETIVTAIAEVEKARVSVMGAVSLQEAKHRSLFVAGWRPAIGWMCAITLFTHFFPRALIANYYWWQIVRTTGTFPDYPLSSEGLISLVGTLVGVGALRTIEKVTNSTRN